MKAAILVTTLIGAIALAPAAQAGHKWKHARDRGFYDEAQVVRIEPITRVVDVTVPRRECWEEEVHRPVTYRDGPDGTGQVVLGGIIGGVIGHQIGGGSGKRAATAAGTLIGAAVGHNLAMKSTRVVQDVEVEHVQRCQVSHERHTEERVDGYDVTYRYRGEIFHTRMPYDPGKTVRVRVDVAPLVDD